MVDMPKTQTNKQTVNSSDSTVNTPKTQRVKSWNIENNEQQKQVK